MIEFGQRPLRKEDERKITNFFENLDFFEDDFLSMDVQNHSILTPFLYRRSRFLNFHMAHVEILRKIVE